VFALGAGLAPSLRPASRGARLYLAAVLGLAALVAGVTLERAWALATAFDEVQLGCAAPCPEVPLPAARIPGVPR
jgi:hypothetical protein